MSRRGTDRKSKIEIFLRCLNSIAPRMSSSRSAAARKKSSAYFMRENLSHRPAIHCIGAALGFITGDQISIPDWADRSYLGWFFRLLAQPRVFIPRLSRAFQLPWLILKYGEKLPPMRGRV